MKRTSTILALGIVLTAVTLAPAGALAQGPRVQAPRLLGPERASDLVTITVRTSTLGTCGGVDFAVTLDTRVRSDGGRETFTIPAGRVLVLTRVEVVPNRIGTPEDDPAAAG